MDITTLTTLLLQLLTTSNPEEIERVKKEITALSLTQNENRDNWERFLKFNQGEIQKMPKQFRKLFRTNGLRAHIRKRKRGNSINYEIRCRSNGYDISASATTIEEAKERFISKLHTIDKGETQTNVPTTFGEFITFYFENYRARVEISPQINVRKIFQRNFTKQQTLRLTYNLLHPLQAI